MNTIMTLKAEIIRDFPFLSPYLYKYPLVATNEGKFIAYTDFKYVYVNEAKTNIATVLHEYLHILFRHNVRFKKCMGIVTNIATDLVINEFLIDSGIPKAMLANTITLESIKQSKMLAQKTIEELINLKENGAFVTEEVLRIITKDPKVHNINIQFNQTHDVSNDDECDDYVEDEEEKQSKYDNNDISEIEKQIAAGITRNQWLLKELGMIKLRMSFSEVLKKILQHVLSYSNSMQSNYMLQDYIALKMGLRYFYRSPKKKWNVVIALDSSGSIGEEHFIKLASSLKKQLMNVNYTYIVCDDVIQQVTNNINELKVPCGFGGTDFRPVFDYVNKMKDVSVLVYMTDTYGYFPSTEPKYPVYWVTQELKAKVPFGKLLIWDPS
jgi:predicted metal-dependent peptidase